ncbi:RNA polymerase sigma factor [Magnetospirillum aberrantis]|uniref:Sigma-70 family RNA polymerase sigma factor n=1 Tax=Magnetospirillum aberrantis SpK TaxID=908842 RepID=A0A7C9QRN6_9PROT|nr:sigma-70 family RNA polymerase sigma factor [Magnetospirillum aberrantis]NFV78925.1 sigma-70 family RNA polymerase sigma factor [Magnetospirillum aberrantis SpK]
MPLSDSPPPTDHRGGDWSYDQLYSHSRVTLRPALAGRLGSAHEADDVLHDAFVRLLQNYARDDLRNPLAMLARIALNIVRDKARRNTVRREALSREIEPPCCVAPPPDPEAGLIERQHLASLRDAIDSLPPRCREVFLLHRIEGLPQGEVASLLGISRSGVEKQLLRANLKLRSTLSHPSPRAIDSPQDNKA